MPPLPHHGPHLHGPHTHGPRHHGPPRYGPHAHTWLYNDEYRAEVRAAGERLHAIAEALRQGSVVLGDISVDVPESVHVALEHFEPAPRPGALALRFDISWERPAGLHRPTPPHRPIFLYEGEVSRAEAPDVLELIAEPLRDGHPIVIRDHAVEVPTIVEVVVRHERASHGELVIKCEVTWGDDVSELQTGSITSLLRA